MRPLCKREYITLMVTPTSDSKIREICTIIFVICFLLEFCTCQTILHGNEDIFTLSSGEVKTFFLENEPIANIFLVFTTRKIRINTKESVCIFILTFGIFLLILMDVKGEFSIKYTTIENKLIERSGYGGEETLLRLSMYGEVTEWWYPRFAFFFDPPPPTTLQLSFTVNSLDLLGFSTRSFKVQVLEETHWRLHVLFIALGIIVYQLAWKLSRSVNYYLFLWFIYGAGLFIIVLSIGTLFLIGKQFRGNISVFGVIPLLLSAGWGAFVYYYIFSPSLLLQNKSVFFANFNPFFLLIYLFTKL